MWRPTAPSPFNLPDIERLIATIDADTDFFDPSAPIVVARAPGRLDLIGGIADYSGALVLQLPLALAACVAAQADDRPLLTIRSVSAGAADADTLVTLPLAAIVPADAPLSYTAAYALLGDNPRRSWAAYVAGVLVVLARERGARFESGIRLLISSGVPAGKGVSSSAAIEVASMQAVCALAGVALGGRDLAILCQLVENMVVGAPCGVMDQMTAACGEQDSLLALLCQPAELGAPVILPPDLEVWGLDSGIRHTVSGADYGAVRVGAFMGYRIIADLAGLAVAPAGAGRVTIDDPRWRGYLANIPPAEWEYAFRDRVPEALGGAEFLERYGGFTDAVTRVDPARSYAVRQPAAHPIYEHHRVRLFRALLEASGLGLAARGGEFQSPSLQLPASSLYELLGELMYQSHNSYSACGLGSDGTDRLVELVRARGPAAGLYGAKITGGGSGGTVAVLAQTGSASTIYAIAAQYERETGRSATVIGGSSPGAAAFGVLWLAHT